MHRLVFLKNALLLAYLALFLNLGPSAHRAQIFGLHDLGGCGLVQAGSVSCDCAGKHTSQENDSHPIDDSLQTQPCDDCAFCRFFDHYDITLYVDDEFLFLSQASNYWQTPSRQIYAVAILQTARGPPAV